MVHGYQDTINWPCIHKQPPFLNPFILLVTNKKPFSHTWFFLVSSFKNRLYHFFLYPFSRWILSCPIVLTFKKKMCMEISIHLFLFWFFLWSIHNKDRTKSTFLLTDAWMHNRCVLLSVSNLDKIFETWVLLFLK